MTSHKDEVHSRKKHTHVEMQSFDTRAKYKHWLESILYRSFVHLFLSLPLFLLPLRSFSFRSFGMLLKNCHLLTPCVTTWQVTCVLAISFPFINIVFSQEKKLSFHLPNENSRRGCWCAYLISIIWGEKMNLETKSICI